MAELQMRFLGDIDLAIDGRPLDSLKSKKAIALLCYLTLTGATHDRLALATLLWADTPESNARMNLRKAVAALRKAIGPYLVITNETLALDKSSRHWADIFILEQAASQMTGAAGEVASIAGLQEAADLYRSDFLAGFYLRNAPLFEEWALVQRTRLRELMLDILQELAKQLAEQDQLTEAISTIRRLLQLEPWREEAHRQLMRLLVQGGRRSEALAQYDTCRQVLEKQFGVEPGPTTVSLWQQIRDMRFDPTAEGLSGGQAAVEARGLLPPSPYRGLFAFREQDAAFFFGREAITQRLLTMANRQPLIAVVGSSGSGKSSLAAAGLVAGIQSEKIWRIAAFRPGNHPLAALSAALVQLLEPQLSETDRLVEAAKMTDALREGVLSLSSVVERINQPEEAVGRLLLLVDQFEELYTLCTDNDERRLFLSRLLDTANQQLLRTMPTASMVLTLRADHMEQALANRQLADALQDSTLILGPMAPDELARAIKKPAELQGVDFEAGLVTRIMEDVGPRSGNLPLLEFALARLWEEQSGWLLTHEAYEAIGQVEGALALHAENVYAQLSASDQRAAHRIFTQMVRPGGRTEDTRRLAARHEIGNRDWLIVQRLADARLVVTGRDPAGQETAELVHETLITAWNRLQKWLDEDRVFRLWQERLRAAMSAWQVSDGDEGALLRGRLLAEAEGWLEEQTDRLGAAEKTFIAASQALRDRELAEREETRMVQERARRRIILGLAILLLIAVGALAFALAQNRRAGAQARLAYARELTAAAVSNLETNTELGIHLALQALQTTYTADGTIVPEAEQALHRAVQSSRLIFALPEGGGLAFSPEGARLATGGEDGLLVISDALTGQPLMNLEGIADPVTGVAFDPDGKLLAAASERRHVLLWDLTTGQVMMELPGLNESGPVLGSTTVAFSPSGRELLLAGPTEDTTIWEVETGRRLVVIENSATADAAFSPDGSKLALTTALWALSDSTPQDQQILTWDDRLFDFADAITGIQDPSSNASVYRDAGSVAFSPDGEYLVTTVISSLAVVLDTLDGEVQTESGEHGGIIHSIAVSPDGHRVATASADGTARVWDAATGEILLTLAGHQDEVIAVAFHPDGAHLATSSLDGTTRMWDISLDTRGEWLSRFDHEGEVHLAFEPSQADLFAADAEGAISRTRIQTQSSMYRIQPRPAQIATLSADPDGARLALGYDDGGLILLDAVSGVLLHEAETGEPISAVAFSLDGRHLLAGDAAGELTLWDSATGDALASWDVHDSYVTGLAISPDGERLTTVSADGRGYIIAFETLLKQQNHADGPHAGGDLPLEATLATLIGHDDLIVSLHSSPDGLRMVTASWDGTAIIWDARNGEPLMTLEGHQGQVMDAAFSPDGARIASVGADGDVIFWDALTGAKLFVLASLDTPLRSLDFDHDGRFLAVAGEDGSVRVYAPLLDDLITLAESRLTRPLSAAECQLYLHQEICP